MSSDITVEPTTDEAYIKSVFLNPAIYQKMCDDNCPSPDKLSGVSMNDLGGVFLHAHKDAQDAGCFWFRPKENQVMEAHTALLPNCRGRDAIRAAKLAIAWIFNHTPAVAINSYAWSDAPEVAWFCRACGLTPVSTENWSATRQGRPVFIQHFSIRRPV